MKENEMRALLGGLTATLLFLVSLVLPGLVGGATATPRPPVPVTEQVWQGPPLTPLDTFEYNEPEESFASFAFTHNGTPRRWFGINLSVTDTPRPLIILLHGSNRSGASMIDMFQGVEPKYILVAPDSIDPRVWSSQTSGQDFLTALLDDVETRASVDRDHVYVFGHSSGAQHATWLAAAGTGLLRAVAGHGGIVSADNVQVTGGPVVAQTPVPAHIFLGEFDHVLDADTARAHGRRLAQAGVTVDLTIIPNQTHWFYDAGPEIATQAVAWFEQFAVHGPQDAGS